MMIAEDYDDTKNLKLFIQFFHYFDCSNQTSWKLDYFNSVKNILKQMNVIE